MSDKKDEYNKNKNCIICRFIDGIISFINENLKELILIILSLIAIVGFFATIYALGLFSLVFLDKKLNLNQLFAILFSTIYLFVAVKFLRDNFFKIYNKYTPTGQDKELENSLNNYVLLAFILSSLILAIGISYINIEFDQSFKIIQWHKYSEIKNKQLLDSNVASISEAPCSSVDGYYKRLVADDTWVCSFTINYHNDSIYRLININVEELSLSKTNNANYSQPFDLSSSSTYTFYLEIPNQNYIKYRIYLDFTNKTKSGLLERWYETTLQPIDILPVSEYQNWKNKKQVWFFALLTLTFFTVFSAVNNLKNLIKNE